MRFTDKAVLVTGAARNIGLEISRTFCREGAYVALLDHDTRTLASSAAELESTYGNVIGIECDVSSEASVQGAVDRAHRQFGRIDVVVNNAGICTLALATDLDERDWDLVLAVNLKGPFLMAKHAAPRMMTGGCIINIASQAAQRAQKFTAHYSASKMGIIGLTRALAVELSPRVRVNAVSPGTVPNELIDQEVNWRISVGENTDREDVMKQWMDRVPMGRFQTAEHIAKGIAFLASEDASEITGETLNISGGAVMV